MSKLTAEQIQTLLGELPNWSWNEDISAITCSLQFRNFSEAFAFMTRVALLAEKAGHHPDWSNSYGRVEISLSTHDVGGVSQKDFDLAARVEALLR